MRVPRRKKDLWDPRMQKKWVWEIDFHEPDPSIRKISLHNTKKHAIAGLGGRKSRVRPENAEKTGLGD